MAKKRWSDMPEKWRRRIIVAAAVEGILKIVALRDLKKRPAASVRGPKWAWGAIWLFPPTRWGPCRSRTSCSDDATSPDDVALAHASRRICSASAPRRRCAGVVQWQNISFPS